MGTRSADTGQSPIAGIQFQDNNASDIFSTDIIVTTDMTETITGVPEPASGALFGLGGLVSLVFFGRRPKR